MNLGTTCIFTFTFFLFYHKIQIAINKTRQLHGPGSPKRNHGAYMYTVDIELPPSKNKVNSNSKARIESKIQ